MKRIFTLFLLSINFLVFSTQNSWQDSWIAGLEFLENDQYEKAREMFANATSNMSEEELQENPDVLINLAHTDNLLQNNDSVLRETKELLNSYKLSDQQRLICGGLLVSALSAKGEEEEALQAYYKYVTNSPMAPKCLFEENRIIISNIPSCGACRETYKSFFIHQLCENQENFHEYGNVWSFEIKKNANVFLKKTTQLPIKYQKK